MASPHSSPSDRKDTWRTPEIEELSNLYVIHPLSEFLAQRFVHWGWSPNLVSFLGLLSALCGAVCFYFYQYLWLSLLGFIFMIGWHIFDGADGQVARLTGSNSEWGKMIDGLCDHLGFGSVYVSLALATMPTYGPWVWVLAATAGISHAIQAGALEFQRDMYDCWVHQKNDKCAPTLQQIRDQQVPRRGLRRILSSLQFLYVSLQHRFAEVDPQLLALRENHILTGDVENEASAMYRHENLTSVARWHLLSANKRTIAVGIFCALKIPLLFFVFELMVLNVLLYWLRYRQRRINTTVITTLSSLELQQPVHQ